MREPSPRTSRLAITGGLLALIACGAGGFLLGRGTVRTPAPVAAPAPVPAAPPAIEQPTQQMLRRSDLIALAAAAADAATSQTQSREEQASIVGRRFELLLPFGCDGPAAEESDAAMRWRYDEKAGALRIHVAPVVWPPAEWLQDPADAEAIEGFWVERPWSSSEVCPASPAVAAAPGADPVTLPGQTLGIVQLITSDTPRQMRRDGEPYAAVVRMPAEAADLEKGLTLRITGRVAQFSNGQAARCNQPGGREQRPICLIAVTLEEVAFQNPATGKLLAVWQPTTDARAGGRTRE